MRKVLLGLGSSLGSKESALFWARTLLNHHREIDLCSSSRIFRSTPLGAANAIFMNQCCIIRTSLSAYDLLVEVKKIERKVGRRDALRWRDRILDIDILLYEQECISLPNLQIPHPNFHERAFVLQPAKEIAENWYHPVMKCSVKDFPIPFPRSW